MIRLPMPARLEGVELVQLDEDGLVGFRIAVSGPHGGARNVTLTAVDAERLVTAFAREGTRAQREFAGVLQVAVEAGVRELAAEATGR